MNTLLFIFLVVGTLVVIFQKTIVDFLFQYCNFDKIMERFARKIKKLHMI